MELRHIRSFVVLAEELHFGRAATRLYLAQPALSQQIRQLEDELGVKLFRRNSHRVALSEEGHLFLPNARAAIASLVAGQEQLQKREQGTSGRVRVGFISTAALTLLPRILHSLQRRYPGIELDLYEKDAHEQLNGLLLDELDLGVMHADLRHPALESFVAETNTVLLALPAKHPLAKHASVNLRSFAQERFILPEPMPHEDFREVALSLCRRAGFVPERVQRVRMLQTAVSLVASGAGCALLPSNFQSIRPRSVKFCRLKGIDHKLPLYLTFRRDLKQSLVRNVVDIVSEASVHSL